MVYFGFQNVTVTAQKEGMSARNAQLEIENESVKNELQNSRADYAALQSDMNDVRDYYHQVDIAASKMGHRCEVRKEFASVFRIGRLKSILMCTEVCNRSTTCCLYPLLIQGY